HRPARAEAARDNAWCARFADVFARFGGQAPTNLREVYTSFVASDEMLGVLVRQRPSVVSFHFGLPPAATIEALRSTGAVLIATVLSLGAVAAQLGTAFIACTESSADAAFRAALASDAANHTTIVRAISGRPARCLANAFTRWAADVADADVPEYPLAYDLGKS